MYDLIIGRINYTFRCFRFFFLLNRLSLQYLFAENVRQNSLNPYGVSRGRWNREIWAFFYDFTMGNLLRRIWGHPFKSRANKLWVNAIQTIKWVQFGRNNILFGGYMIGENNLISFNLCLAINTDQGRFLSFLVGSMLSCMITGWCIYLYNGALKFQ